MMGTKTFYNGVEMKGWDLMARSTQRILEELHKEDREPLVTSIWFRIQDPKTGEYRWRWWGHPRTFDNAMSKVRWNEEWERSNEEYAERQRIEEKRQLVEDRLRQEKTRQTETMVADLETSSGKADRMGVAFKRLDARAQAVMLLLAESIARIQVVEPGEQGTLMGILMSRCCQDGGPDGQDEGPPGKVLQFIKGGGA